jgi:hypothetical protein
MLQSIAGNKPLAIVLAGHNGSGKSTLWYDNLVTALYVLRKAGLRQIPKRRSH